MHMEFGARDYGYTIISRFEEILRGSCIDKLETSATTYKEYIPQGVIDAAKKREEELDNIEILLENIDFIHLKEIFTYKNNYSLIINQEKLSKDEFVELMESLYLLRCKIAHIRNYFTNSDLSSLIEESNVINGALLCPEEKYLDYTQNVLSSPQELAKKVPLDFYEDEQVATINNLPVADYELEGGFVGRADDEEKIIIMMKSDNQRVVTIAGAGGVGKSALALKVVNDVLYQGIIKYDFVVWVSAKENKLSYLGIEDIEPSLNDYEELLDTILSVVGLDLYSYSGDISKKEDDIHTLFDACERVLLIIDNLETITDERIINFILDINDAHNNVRFLITSRRGLGQVERRYELKELKEKDAVHLFRVICKEKGLKELQKADEKILSKYVKKVYCYPLAIKWVLGQVAIGKDISIVVESINEQSSDISKFCFEQVFSELSNEAKNILYVLCMENEAVPKGVLKYISNLNDIVFEDCIQELLIVSLILPEPKINKDSGEIHSYYSLLPLTRGFVKVQLDNNRDIKSQLQERKVTVQTTIEEADRAKAQYRFSMSNFGATTEEEKIASMLAQTAYQKYQSGNYLEAVETFKRAINIAPKFASIYRNWAVIESQESHWTDSDELMKKAAQLNPNDTQIWLVWGNIKRKSDKIKEAYEYYEKAYHLSPEDNVVLNSYAQAISRMGDYERADKLFKEALGLGGNVPHTKHLIINYTSIAENLKKWTEYLLVDRNYEEAKSKIQYAKDAIEQVLKLDENDSKANDLYMDILYTYGLVYEKEKQYDKALEKFEQVLKLPHSRFRSLEHYSRAVIQIVKIYCKQGNYKKAKEILLKEEKNIKRVRKESILDKYKKLEEQITSEIDRKIGQIVSVNIERKYIVIENLACPGERYLCFANSFYEYIQLSDVLLGKNVSFIAENQGEKNRATKVRFI